MLYLMDIIDFFKAFGIAPFERLSGKLKHYDINGYIQRDLSGVGRGVKTGGVDSSERGTNAGKRRRKHKSRTSNTYFF